ncbi:VOC family protein [Bacillus sp. FJAT-29814]|uniref:VOC family protein n=1 Tax=Bacillus sp. FJAT-29814 TaxID=1729688 RepID=UPI000832C050|nr:VOC family protein [Bacillus sp. FJAT-29814]
MEIVGFGGVFWRTRQMDVLKAWYKEVLGLSMEDWNGTIITPGSGNQTVFSFFSENSDYFPKEQSVMLNFQVKSMEECLKHLEQKGVPLIRDPEISEFGTFVWIADPEGRRIELWEK